MKTFNIFDDYFEKLGISTRYNTLGYTQDMVSAYVHETRDIVGKDISHFKKSQCYSQYYDMKERPKYTGFEWAKEEDNTIRRKLYKIVDGMYIFDEQYFLDGTVPDLDYLTLLIESLPHGNNLLYLSGGADSEMVALSMISANIQFTPVILQYTKNGRVMNDFDTIYATKFCNKHHLEPYYYSIEVLEVWDTDEFIELVSAIRTTSPQQGIYAHAVLEIDKIFPNATHMFGGEIRYRTDVECNVKNPEERADLAMLVKTAPGFNGVTYTHAGTSNASVHLCLTDYETFGFPFMTPTSGTPLSGAWNTGGSLPLPPAPNDHYEHKLTCTAVSNKTGTARENPLFGSPYPNFIAIVIPYDEEQGTYTPYGIGSVTTLSSGPGTVTATFLLELRNPAKPSVVTTSTYTLRLI